MAPLRSPRHLLSDERWKQIKTEIGTAKISFNKLAGTTATDRQVAVRDNINVLRICAMAGQASSDLAAPAKARRKAVANSARRLQRLLEEERVIIDASFSRQLQLLAEPRKSMKDNAKKQLVWGLLELWSAAGRKVATTVDGPLIRFLQYASDDLFDAAPETLRSYVKKFKAG